MAQWVRFPSLTSRPNISLKLLHLFVSVWFSLGGDRCCLPLPRAVKSSWLRVITWKAEPNIPRRQADSADRIESLEGEPFPLSLSHTPFLSLSLYFSVGALQSPSPQFISAAPGTQRGCILLTLLIKRWATLVLPARPIGGFCPRAAASLIALPVVDAASPCQSQSHPAESSVYSNACG